MKMKERNNDNDGIMGGTFEEKNWDDEEEQ